MNLSTIQTFPIMGEVLSLENTLPLDFTDTNKALTEINLCDTAEFNAFVFGQMQTAEKKYGVGGYLEKRAIYRRSEVFATESSNFRR